MTADFVDITIVGLDEEHTTRADPNLPLYDVHFVLSAPLPAGWARFAQATIGPRGVAGRRGWPQSRHLVVRCPIDEVEVVLAALGPVVEATNWRYRTWAADETVARAAEEAFDRGERQKLRELTPRLVFN
jgi:hypothetical protein